MKLKLQLPSLKYKEKALDYIKEFHLHNSPINGTGGLDSYTSDYGTWLKSTLNAHNGIVDNPKYVPASTYFVIDELDTIVGMVNIRHELNQYLIDSGSGHIGYSVRPTERRKRYATEILKQALLLLSNNHNVEQAMVGCYEDNIGSKKTILNNHGILDRRILEDDGKVTLAFLIDLNKNN